MGFWAWIKSIFGGREKKTGSRGEKPLISIVMLLRETRYLDDRILADLIYRAWKVDLRQADPKATEFVVGASPVFIVQCKDRHYLINNFSAPYGDNMEAVAKSIKELRLRRAVEEHKAWLSVDLMGLRDDRHSSDLSDAYQRIGKLIAELADADCTALYCPATNRMIPYDDSIEEKLRGPNVLEVFESPPYVPVLQVAADDPRMEAAVAEARRRWPEFVSQFERRRPEQAFMIKAPFTDGSKTEFMWAAVTAIEGDQILGTLENEPAELKTLRLGDRVRILRENLNDWIFADKNKKAMEGGFTIKVIQDAQKD